jgi:hypothetical protein
MEEKKPSLSKDRKYLILIALTKVGLHGPLQNKDDPF